MSEADASATGAAAIIGLPLAHGPELSRLMGVLIPYEGVKGFMLIYAWSTEPHEGSWLELLVTQGDAAVVQAVWPTLEAARASATRRGEGARLLGRVQRSAEGGSR